MNPRPAGNWEVFITEWKPQAPLFLLELNLYIFILMYPLDVTTAATLSLFVLANMAFEKLMATVDGFVW